MENNRKHKTDKKVTLFQWLLVDIQMMMGGKHKHSIDPEEYVFAALNLYLDIVNILMMVLAIVGIASN